MIPIYLLLLLILLAIYFVRLFSFYLTACDTLRACSLNVCYDPRLPSSHSFEKRWPHIVKLISPFPYILLQEAHESFLPHIEAFAAEHGYHVEKCLYHTIRDTYLVTLVRTTSDLKFVGHMVGSSLGHYSKMLVMFVLYKGILIIICNVHLPPDFRLVGERLKATNDFLTMASSMDNCFVLGDWNTLPPYKGKHMQDKEQLEIAASLGHVIPWTFVNAGPASSLHQNPCPETTFHGYPHESEDLQAYNAWGVLDRLWVRTKNSSIAVMEAIAEHHFITVDGVEMSPSDHVFLCVDFKIRRNKFLFLK